MESQKRSWLSCGVLAAIWLYQRLISPLLPPSCRFHPSCSAYMAQAINEWGLIRGSALGLRRLLRCHPLNEGGIDPVP